MIKVHLMIWFSVLVLEILITAFMGSAESIRKSLGNEIEQTRAFVGNRASDHVITHANNWFQAAFGDAFDYARKTLVHKDTPTQGAENALMPFMQKLSTNTNNVVTTFWANTYRLIFRLHMWLIWVVPVVLLLIPAVTSGLVARKLKDYRFGYTDPVKFSLATHALIFVFCLPLALLLAPISVSPWIYPSWGVVMALLTYIGLSNYQTTG